ncbi:hypothetical protein Tco_0022361, partial [Tanacetum coccineum]
RAEVEEDDRERALFLGGKISLGRKKSWESNINDSGNTRDGGKTVGGALGACGSGIGDSLLVALYVFMTFIYESLWKGEMATTSVHRSSIRFNINKKKVSLDVDIFRDILLFCPKILGQVFEDLPLEQDILSFIRDLGHNGDITYHTDVNVDYLHQPWRAFATVINKCLSGKETRMDKICLSRA